MEKIKEQMQSFLEDFANHVVVSDLYDVSLECKNYGRGKIEFVFQVYGIPFAFDAKRKHIFGQGQTYEEALNDFIKNSQKNN